MLQCSATVLQSPPWFCTALFTFGFTSRSKADERQERKHLNTSHPTADAAKPGGFLFFSVPTFPTFERKPHDDTQPYRQ